MSATNPDQTSAPHPAPPTVSAGSEQPVWLRWYGWYKRPLQRMILWLGVSAVGAYAMGSAANHFLAGGVKEQDANGSSAAAAPTSGGGSQYGGWWNPVTAPIGASSKDSGVTVGTASSSSSSNGSPSNGNSIIPVDRNAEFSGGSLTLNNPVAIDSNASQTYAVLGLGMRSFSAPTMTPDTPSSAELHFSLSGDTNLVPVDNLSAGGLSVTNLVAIPEPSTAGLLAAGFAGVVLRRRRKAALLA